MTWTSEQQQIVIEALQEAVDLITREYCSHDGPHSSPNPSCYAEKQIAALAMCVSSMEPT